MGRSRSPLFDALHFSSGHFVRLFTVDVVSHISGAVSRGFQTNFSLLRKLPSLVFAGTETFPGLTTTQKKSYETLVGSFTLGERLSLRSHISVAQSTMRLKQEHLLVMSKVIVSSGSQGSMPYLEGPVKRFFRAICPCPENIIIRDALVTSATVGVPAAPWQTFRSGLYRVRRYARAGSEAWQDRRPTSA
jgi:hypothetical protein